MFCFTLEYDVMNAIQLLLSDARGVYIPRDFVDNFDLDKWHVDNKYIHLLSSPNNEFYWDIIVTGKQIGRASCRERVLRLV